MSILKKLADFFSNFLRGEIGTLKICFYKNIYKTCICMVYYYIKYINNIIIWCCKKSKFHRFFPVFLSHAVVINNTNNVYPCIFHNIFCYKNTILKSLNFIGFFRFSLSFSNRPILKK
jgi:hypothetical protein